MRKIILDISDHFIFTFFKSWILELNKNDKKQVKNTLNKIQ